MKNLDTKSVALLGRGGGAVALNYNKSIIITTDILKFGENSPPPSIKLDHEQDKIEAIAKAINLLGKGSNHTPESVVYGESLVELLRWIIKVLMEHKHPPNAPPIPTYLEEANSRSRNLEVDLLNKRVKTS